MAISVVTNWTALAAGGSPYTIDSTGADCLCLWNQGYNSTFSAGKAIPTTLTYNSVNMLTGSQYTFASDGSTNSANITLTGNDGTAASNGQALYVYCGFSAGSHSLVVTQQTGTYGGGPRTAYALFSGVDQTTPVRTGSVAQWNRLVTAASIAFSGLTSGDLVNIMAGDFNDTAHTATGSASEILDSTANNGSSIWAGQFTASGATGTGGITGGTDLVGFGFPLVAAGAGGGLVGPLIRGGRLIGGGPLMKGVLVPRHAPIMRIRHAPVIVPRPARLIRKAA